MPPSPRPDLRGARRAGAGGLPDAPRLRRASAARRLAHARAGGGAGSAGAERMQRTAPLAGTNGIKAAPWARRKWAAPRGCGIRERRELDDSRRVGGRLGSKGVILVDTPACGAEGAQHRMRGRCRGQRGGAAGRRERQARRQRAGLDGGGRDGAGGRGARALCRARRMATPTCGAAGPDTFSQLRPPSTRFFHRCASLTQEFMAGTVGWQSQPACARVQSATVNTAAMDAVA